MLLGLTRTNKQLGIWVHQRPVPWVAWIQKHVVQMGLQKENAPVALSATITFALHSYTKPLICMRMQAPA